MHDRTEAEDAQRLPLSAPCLIFSHTYLTRKFISHVRERFMTLPPTLYTAGATTPVPTRTSHSEVQTGSSVWDQHEVRKRIPIYQTSFYVSIH